MASTITIIFIYISSHLMNGYPTHCKTNSKCIVDCTYPNKCTTNIINATQSVSLIIFGCNNNCDDMSIYCPHNTDNIEYECHISGYFNSTITNANIYAKSMVVIDIMFDEIINSTLHCDSTTQCNINWNGNSCSNNNTICKNNYIST
eukprot:500943_1